MIITLEAQHSAYRLSVDTTGARIMGASFQGVPLLQGPVLQEFFCSSVPCSPDESGGFALVPVVNRVAGNSFDFRGEHIVLKPTSPDGKEYLHGLAWLEQWQVQAQGDDFVELVYNDPGRIEAGYVYSATVRYTLLPRQGGIQVTVKVRHQGDKVRPYGIGFHPYFVFDAATDRLALNAAALAQAAPHYLTQPAGQNFTCKSLLGADGISREETGILNFEFAPEKPQFVPDVFINHCYHGFMQAALYLAALPEHRVVLRSPEAAYLMMYHVSGGSFLALEPQTQMVNAAHAPDLGGLRPLSPSCPQLELNVFISVEPVTA